MKYTISCCYFQPYLHDVVVEADSVEEACQLAIDAADNSPNWRPVDDPMPTHVDGIYIGETSTGRYWDKPDDAPDDPPIPAPFDVINAQFSAGHAVLSALGVPLSTIIEFLEQVAAGNSEHSALESNAEDILVDIQRHLHESGE